MQRRYYIKDEYDGHITSKGKQVKKGEMYDGNQLFRYYIPSSWCNEVFIKDSMDFKIKSSLTSLR